MRRKGHSCICYDNLDPEQYEARYKIIPREKYLKEHWFPLMIAALSEYCKNKIVLDLGCGTGTYGALISEDAVYVVGVDISGRMLDYAKKRGSKLSLVLADAHFVPLKSHIIDTVVCIGLFEYVERRKVLEEIGRVLKLGGICIIQCPNKYSAARMPYKMVYRVLGKKYRCEEPSYKEMLKLFKRNDFKVLNFRMDDGLIWLPNFLDKLIGRKIYLFFEEFFRFFGRNPSSNIMLFVAKKGTHIRRYSRN
jgi:SAM-dependent methyltransferase